MPLRLRRLPRHARFEYVPRFYDPDKEEREARKPDYERGDVGETLKRQIAHGFGRKGRGSQFQFRTQRSAQASASNRRLLIIIAALGLTAYYLLEANVAGLVAAFQ